MCRTKVKWLFIQVHTDPERAYLKKKVDERHCDWVFLGFAKPANPNRAWICWTCFIVTPVNNETNNIKSTLQPTHMKELSLRNNGLLSRTVSAWLYFLPWFLQAYEKQKQAQRSSNQLESKSEERERVERFKTKENSIVSKPINPFTSGACMTVKIYLTMLATRGNQSSDSTPQTLRYGCCCRHLCCFNAPKLFLRHFL